jgi:hypothetical protein
MRVVSADSAELIVNNRVNIFGTQYDPRADRVRIPLRRAAAGASVERLTLVVRDGALHIEWGNGGWSVPVSVAKAPPVPLH